MGRVPRELFVPASSRSLAYDDAALPIGRGQTISQPFIVAAMCELLELGEGERVLDVGTGSGYAAAVLAALGCGVVGDRADPRARRRRARGARSWRAHRGVEVRIGDGRLGAPDRAPFDAIAVAAASRTCPPALVEQLAEGGRLVLPLGDSEAQRLVQVDAYRRPGSSSARSFPCRFVPLVAIARADRRAGTTSTLAVG